MTTINTSGYSNPNTVLSTRGGSFGDNPFLK